MGWHRDKGFCASCSRVGFRVAALGEKILLEVYWNEESKLQSEHRRWNAERCFVNVAFRIRVGSSSVFGCVV